MGQLYCFSCGKGLNEAEQERAGGAPVPICDSCRQAGPQVDPGDVRWMVRRSEGPLQGPLSREGVHDRLARDLLGPYDQVCRVNAEWQRLVEHPDFRACFIPGTPEQAELDRLKKQVNTEKSAETARQRRRILRATGLLVIGLTLPVLTTSTGLGVLPESWIETLRNLAGGVWGEAKSVISSASDERQAAETVVKAAGMPAQNAVARLRDAYPTVEEPLELLLARGEASLWEGTQAGFSQARDDFERAVASGPDDPQAVSGLAIAYAALLNAERGQIVTVVELAARAEALAPGSAAALRAGAVAALAGGDRAKAAELAQACLALKVEGAAPDAPAKEDPGCAALLAVANRDAPAIAALSERFPEATPIGLGRLLVAAEDQDWGLALRLSRALAKRNPEDPTAYAFQARAAAAMGLWREARDAAGLAGKHAPWRLDLRALHAELLLKIDGRAADALAVYEALLADPLWKEQALGVRVLADAAAAALEAGKSDRALELTEAALSEEKTNLAAVLTRARALRAAGKTTESDAVLATIDNSRLQGRMAARYLVGVARLNLAAGLNKPAAAALDAALEIDPSYRAAHLDRARVWLASDNPSAAVKQLLDLAFLDASRDSARTPLVQVWYPETGWADLRRELEDRTSTDVRLAADAPAAVGVLAWAAGQPDARAALKRALDANPSSSAAHAALAWLLIERGESAAALSHVERVLADKPQLGLFHALRGRALGALGRGADAEKAFTQALVNASKEPSVYRWRAELRARAKNTEGAVADLKQALELAPDDLMAAVALVDLTTAIQ